MHTSQFSTSPYLNQDGDEEQTNPKMEIVMTTEKQKYSSHIDQQVKSTLFSQVMVSALMIVSALILLENLV